MAHHEQGRAGTRLRRALFTVSDKTGIEALALAMQANGTEIVATGKTATVLEAAGVRVVPIERISGSPEAFQGRMKTLSFGVCSGILYRRGDASDEADLERLKIAPIDCVVVNFYPFELTLQQVTAEARAQGGGAQSQASISARSQASASAQRLIEVIDIGGPTLVRAAAKNSPDVLVLTDPAQYAQVIDELKNRGEVSATTAQACAARAWDRIDDYDRAIASRFGERAEQHFALRYGENPHQSAHLELDADPALGWAARLTAAELSYNNILDLTAAYSLVSDLQAFDPAARSVVIVKHNNPCGAALVPAVAANSHLAQLEALKRAWEGDPVSAFGGVIAFSHPIEAPTAEWLAERFVDAIAAPGLAAESAALKTLLGRRKNLKAVPIHRFGAMPTRTRTRIPGGWLEQETDLGLHDPLRDVTEARFTPEKSQLARFGIAVCRALKSNALAIVRALPSGGYQLVGAGQGQPNRVEALERLAVPRAREVLKAAGGSLGDCVLVSDAFFPFRDTVDLAHQSGLRFIVQPGGSIKDAESITAANEHGIAMAFTGVRHFRH